MSTANQENTAIRHVKNELMQPCSSSSSQTIFSGFNDQATSLTFLHHFSARPSGYPFVHRAQRSRGSVSKPGLNMLMESFALPYLQDDSPTGGVAEEETRDPWILHQNSVNKHFLFSR